MFDIVSIRVLAGKGGDGAVSFRREKFVPFGGPDGGDGGNGGDVVLLADEAQANLKMYTQKALYKAEKGGNGQGKKMHGKNGPSLILKVPVGTMVFEESEDEDKVLLGDLENPGQEIVIAYGGKGGWGNVHFAHSTNQTPRLAQVGEDGEIRNLFLELRMIADVGIIGYPNVGKSSLLAWAAAANPRVADFRFTTKEPELGVVTVGNTTFVMAEIPGLIEGAHQGRGLGHDFLRHSTRTRVFIHLVDGSSASPVEDMIKVNNELALYDPALAKKQQLVVVNKVDLPRVAKRKNEISTDFKSIGITVQFVSAATGEGVPELMESVQELLKQTTVKTETGVIKIFRPQPRQPGFGVTREGDAFVIHAPDIARVIDRVDMSDPTVRGQVYGLLIRKGIVKMLEKAGSKGGDRVRCGHAEWDW